MLRTASISSDWVEHSARLSEHFARQCEHSARLPDTRYDA